MMAQKAARVLDRLPAALQPARLLLAAKTALAVGISWVIALHMPGVTDEYPYYAPLGVLVSMYPTLMDSLRSSLQTLLGLLAGIGLALVVIVTWGPNLWTIPVAAGAGVLLSGTGWFGVGKEYVPIAALFVLIIGGQQFDDYSLGYLTQMGVGAAVGLVVNLAIAPRTLTAAASARVDAFREQLAGHLRDIAQALGEAWPPERDAWAQDAASLSETAREVRHALVEADVSRKGNPRARHGRHDTAREHARLEQLEAIVMSIREVSEALADAIWERPGGLRLERDLAEPLQHACAHVADCIAQAGEDIPAAHEARAEAARAVRGLIAAVGDTARREDQPLGTGALVAMNLRRILMRLQAGARP